MLGCKWKIKAVHVLVIFQICVLKSSVQDQGIGVS